MPTPEDQARENIDHLLTQAAWAVRNQNDANILAYRGVETQSHEQQKLEFNRGTLNEPQNVLSQPR